MGKIFVPETDFPEKAKAGVIVGLSHPENSSSTLRGFVEIQHPSSETWKGLTITCFHMVYPQVNLGLSEPDNQPPLPRCLLICVHSNPEMAPQPNHPHQS